MNNTTITTTNITNTTNLISMLVNTTIAVLVNSSGYVNKNNYYIGLLLGIINYFLS